MIDKNLTNKKANEESNVADPENELINYLKVFVEKEAQSILALKEYINPHLIVLLKKLLNRKGRIFMVGVGTSGVIAKRATHLFFLY